MALLYELTWELSCLFWDILYQALPSFHVCFTTLLPSLDREWFTLIPPWRLRYLSVDESDSASLQVADMLLSSGVCAQAYGRDSHRLHSTDLLDLFEGSFNFRINKRCRKTERSYNECLFAMPMNHINRENMLSELNKWATTQWSGSIDQSVKPTNQAISKTNKAINQPSNQLRNQSTSQATAKPKSKRASKQPPSQPISKGQIHQLL